MAVPTKDDVPIPRTKSAPAKLMLCEHLPSSPVSFSSERIFAGNCATVQVDATFHREYQGDPLCAGNQESVSYAKRVAMWLVYAFTQAPTEPDIPELQGLVLQSVSQSPTKRAESGIPASAGLASAVTRPQTSMSRIAQAVYRYPGFLAREVPQYALPLTCALLPTIINGLVWRAQVISTPEVDGRIHDIRYSEDLTDAVAHLGLLPVALQVASTFAFIAGLICSLWSWHLMRGIVIKSIIPSATLAFALQVGSLHLQRAGAGTLVCELFKLAYNLLVFCTAARSFSRAGRATQNWLFGVFMIGVTIVVQLLVNVQVKVLPGILQSSDATKSLYVAIINPCICEMLLITPTRVMVRALRHNHPSTSFLPLTITIITKQMLGRFVAATVKSKSWVFVLSVCGSLGEILFRTSVRHRDYLLYGSLFGRCLKSGQNPYVLMEHPRNRTLRGHSSAFETMSNLVAVWNGVIFVLVYGFTKDGDAQLSLQDLVITGAIQTVFELVTDLVSTLLLALFLHIDFFDLVRNRRWCWCVPGTLSIFLLSAYSNNSLLTQILCHGSGEQAAFFNLC